MYEVLNCNDFVHLIFHINFIFVRNIKKKFYSFTVFCLQNLEFINKLNVTQIHKLFLLQNSSTAYNAKHY